MSDLPRQIPLAAGDYFMHSQDWRMRSCGLPGNICRVALRLGPGLDRSRLVKKIESSQVFEWLAQLDICRPWPVLPPRWKAATTPRGYFSEHQEANTAPDRDRFPQAVLDRKLHASSGPAVSFDLVQRPSGGHDFVLSWNHSLLDARGAELILRHVQSPDNGDAEAFQQALINPEQPNGGLGKWWEAVGRARRSLPWLKESGKAPLFSLLPKRGGPARCSNRTRLLSFSDEELAGMNARLQALNATFRRSHFYLAASVRAVHAVARKRGEGQAAYLIPVPHDTRRRGAKGPVFSNHLSILFYRLEASIVNNPAAVIEELTKQMMEQIRTEFPVNAMSALEMFKPLPANLYLYQLGKPSGGRFASFCFSDSGETCAGFREFMGAPIESVTHVVPTWRPPGLTILFWSFAGKPHALLSYADDCLTPDEADLLERTLRSALTEEIVE